MRFRAGVLCGSAILGASLLLACFPDYFFFDPQPLDAGKDSGAGDTGFDARPFGDAGDAANTLDAGDASDALDEANAPDALDPLDAADADEG